jgi:hypothetical protein
MMKSLCTSWWKLKYGSSNICFVFICKSRNYHCNVELNLGTICLVLFYFVECLVQIVFQTMKDFMDYLKQWPWNYVHCVKESKVHMPKCPICSCIMPTPFTLIRSKSILR